MVLPIWASDKPVANQGSMTTTIMHPLLSAIYLPSCTISRSLATIPLISLMISLSRIKSGREFSNVSMGA